MSGTVTPIVAAPTEGWAAYVSGLRARTGLSQPELARRLGVSALAVADWEHGVVPRARNAARLRVLAMELADRPPPPPPRTRGSLVRCVRLFTLWRKHDVTGLTGTGKVAEGVIFTDGTVVLRWTPAAAATVHVQSTVLYASIEDVRTLHGHEGKTQIIYRE